MRRPQPGQAQPAIRLAVAWLVLTLVPAGPASAETWYESYDKAEQALAQERWGDAVRHLNAALQDKPDSTSNARTYGMRFVDYFPYLQLGIAYFHLGQLDAAQQAFETEQRQGAIARSTESLARLRDYQSRVDRQLAEAEKRARQRVDDVVSGNLTRARELESRGSLSEALASFDRVLAVVPEHQEASTARARLLEALTAQRRREQVAQRRRELVQEGRSELSAGRYGEAASHFTEALAIADDPSIRDLLAQAQTSLRQQIGEEQSRVQREQFISRSLDRAGRHLANGELDETARELQAILALEPTHPAARRLQRRLLDQQAAATEAGAQDSEVAGLMADAERRLAAGDAEGALRAANRVLVADPAHPTALRQISRAYGLLSRSLLSPDETPPTLLLDPSPTGIEVGEADGQPRTQQRSAELTLTGTVYDDSPVSLRLLEADTRLGEPRGEPVGEPSVEQREFQGVWITDFRWVYRLQPGISRIEVEAIDAAGNATRVERTVEYAVPFTRSRWLPISATALALALVGLWFVWRAQRKRRLLRERFNPYIAGAPILEQERFFGRQQLIEYVLRRISNNSIMLYGERRIGKTSLQHRLKRCLAGLDDPVHEFYPVYVDLQGIPQDRFFATLAAEIFHGLAAKLGGLEPSEGVGSANYGYRELVKDLHRVLRALRARTGKKVKLVLLIDEVDELNDYDPRINQRLRSLFMRAFSENLVSVVSGVAIKKHWEREGSPWYNFFQEIEVKPLDAAEARDLIAAPVRGVFTFEDGVADQIIRRTDGKPYLVQRLCSALVDRMHEQRRRRITADDLEAACRVEGL